jgi:peptidoglycan/LPS O-acetylase OafA/YrhL
MRGLAALCVFLEHFFIPFWGGIFYAYGGHEETTVLQLPAIRLLYSGSPMVCIFFIVSGIALSLKPSQLTRRREWGQLHQALESMVFRRGIRLFGPPLLGSFALMAAAHLHLCDVQSSVTYEGPAEIQDEFWMKQPQYVSGFWLQMGEWLDFIVAKVLIPSTWRGTTTGRDFGDLEHVQYGSQLWTVPVEFWCSMLLFVTLVGSARLRAGSKFALFGLLTGFSLWVSRWDMALFLFGSMLADTPAFQTEILSKPRPMWKGLLFTLVLGSGLHLASYPELGGAQTPGFAWLSPVSSNSRVWQSIGAALVVTGIANMTVVRNFLSGNVFLYFGRISYALYIVHIPLLATGGWRLVPVVWEVTGRDTYMAHCAGLVASLGIIIPLLVWLADLVHRLIDEPCIVLARNLETYLQLPYN